MEHAKVYQDGSATKESIENARENALVSLLNGKPGQRLDDLRYLRYQEELATKRTNVEPNNPSPTPSAANNTAFVSSVKFSLGKEKK